MAAAAAFSSTLINAFVDGPAKLPLPLKHLVYGVQALRFGRCLKRAAYNITDNPASFAAGVIGQFVFSESAIMQAASHIAVISRCIFELYDSHNALLRAWNDLAAITNHVPIELIKHRCRQKPKNMRTFLENLICHLPHFPAQAIVKMQDVSHLVSKLSGAVFDYICAWDAVYCASKLNTLTRFSANAELFINIKQTYRRICEDEALVTELLGVMSGPVNALLHMGKVQMTANELIEKIKQRSTEKAFLKKGIFSQTDFFSTISTLARKTAFTFIQLTTNLPVAITPVKPPKEHSKQPILQKRAIHGHISGSHKTCKAGSGAESRRFYKAFE